MAPDEKTRKSKEELAEERRKAEAFLADWTQKNCHPFVAFLRRYPWAAKGFLERYYGPQVMKAMIADAGSLIKEVSVPGIGLVYADVEEPVGSAFYLWRCNILRDFVLGVMGREAIRTGFSPTPVADGEFDWDGIWWRVWVDLGAVAPESMAYIQHPPRHFGYGVRDLILTVDADRFQSIASQINMNWPGSGEVTIWHVGSRAYYRVNRESQFGGIWKPYTFEQANGYLMDRRKSLQAESAKTRVSNKEQVLSFSGLSWQILLEMGNHPYLSAWELSYLVALKNVGQNLNHQRLVTKLAEAKHELQRLEQNHMFAYSKMKEHPGRMVLSWLSLDHLSRYMGVEPNDMLRFQPWPQRRDEDRGHTEYSPAWFIRLNEHQSLCRQFSLSLAFGGRSVANNLGWPQVDLISTIASRLVYQKLDIFREKATEWVIPDGQARLAIMQGTGNGKVEGAKALIKRDLFIEIDRATNRVSRIEDRLDRYARVWPLLRKANPALVWVIAGGSGDYARETRIIEMMRARRLEGWTVTLDRLVLAFDHSFWTAAPPVFGSIELDAVGMMAPYRRIWRNTISDSEEHLLGHAPWLTHGEIPQIHSNIFHPV